MTPAARERVMTALVHLQAAQNHLADACSDISPVVGMVKEWERLGKLYDKVKAEWHRLNRLDGAFRLDSESQAKVALHAVRKKEKP